MNLVLGHGGLLPLCQAALQAVGAYASALLVMNSGWPFAAAAVAVAGSVLLAFLVAIPIQRFRGDYFVLATMGFQVILVTAANNLVSVTNGPYGISGIPRPSVLGWTPRSVPAFLEFTAIVAAVATLVFYAVSVSPFGRALRAVRDDPVAAVSVGLDVRRYRRSAFAIAGGLAGLAGVLQAAYVSYIDPTYYGLEESISDSFFSASGLVPLMRSFMPAATAATSLASMAICGGSRGAGRVAHQAVHRVVVAHRDQARVRGGPRLHVLRRDRRQLQFGGHVTPQQLQQHLRRALRVVAERGEVLGVDAVAGRVVHLDVLFQFPQPREHGPAQHRQDVDQRADQRLRGEQHEGADHAATVAGDLIRVDHVLSEGDHGDEPRELVPRGAPGGLLLDEPPQGLAVRVRRELAPIVLAVGQRNDGRKSAPHTAAKAE